ncbi:16S rRNA (guanine(527)-N(7))-methyltransferase RsmG [Kineobactrum sediminis]|uniref:Ribosomal RNA small subunit methyltransferase G n=1 Tax=Kineobactrum sediminis TaxID=1905677 RepID=A0A2N5Y5U7_9GAMM|nr:16S rRNA (guanine(527)-N(7))-methyltransferase RsmG [Kineobactrum sediminis]
MATDLEKTLSRGCHALDISLEPRQQEQLLTYLQLMQKWNRAYNLTAVREPAAMVTRHLLDSLAVLPYLPEGRCLDVGTGAGLPGIPLAILFPEREFHLLDSNGKKTRFLFAVKTSLGLANVTIHNTRVEAFTPQALFDVILSRAFASLADMVAGTRHLLAPGGCFLAMKGAYPPDELEAVARECVLKGIYPLAVPGLNEQRHLVELALCQPTQ